MSCRDRSFACLSAAAVAVLASPVLAHHAYDANYIRETGSIEGVVVEVFWGNPHVHYYLEVTNDDGSTTLWDVESDNLGVMARAGWTSETLEVGDVVRVSGRLGREGRARLALDLESVESLE
jgi:hypothetical protein